MLRAMLKSWDADVPLQEVWLMAYNEDDFTRQDFVDLLRAVGRLLKKWALQSPVSSSVDGEVGERHARREVCVELYDWEVWEDWWWRHLAKCFRTFAKSDRLYKTYDPRKCSSSSRSSVVRNTERSCLTPSIQ